MKTEIEVFNRQLAGQLVCQRRDNGYINATALCKAAGKLCRDYFRATPTKPFLSELSRMCEIRTSDLKIVIRGFEIQQGTWVHPYVAINLAQWASPKFAVAVSKWVFEWMSGKAREESAARAAVAETPQAPRALAGKSCSELYAEYVELGGQIAVLTQKKLELRDALVAALGSAKELRNDDGLVIAKMSNYTRIDWKRIAESFNPSEKLIEANTTRKLVPMIFATPHARRRLPAPKSEKAPRNSRTGI